MSISNKYGWMLYDGGWEKPELEIASEMDAKLVFETRSSMEAGPGS